MNKITFSDYISDLFIIRACFFYRLKNFNYVIFPELINDDSINLNKSFKILKVLI